MSAYFSADGLRVLLLILAALAQIAASAAPRLLGWEDDISSRSQSLPTPIVPPGWAFSIWGLIFLGSLAFAIYATLPGPAHVIADLSQGRVAGRGAFHFGRALGALGADQVTRRCQRSDDLRPSGARRADRVHHCRCWAARALGQGSDASAVEPVRGVDYGGCVRGVGLSPHASRI